MSMESGSIMDKCKQCHALGFTYAPALTTQPIKWIPCTCCSGLKEKYHA